MKKIDFISAKSSKNFFCFTSKKKKMVHCNKQKSEASYLRLLLTLPKCYKSCYLLSTC